MKALTICQPFASLICLPDEHPLAKRVENRTWPTSYRGPLLIHAGKSQAWMNRNDEYDIPLSEMSFGAIVGVCNLVGCVNVNGMSDCMRATAAWPWLETHMHTEGPYCFVLTDCRRFENPIAYRGAQGFFDVPEAIVAEAIEQIDGPWKGQTA